MHKPMLLVWFQNFEWGYQDNELSSSSSLLSLASTLILVYLNSITILLSILHALKSP